MIEFVGPFGVLDPVGARRSRVEQVLVDRGVRHPPELLVRLLSTGGGGLFPYVVRGGAASNRSFSEIATATELSKLRSELRDDLIVVATGGGGDMLLVAPTGEVLAEVADHAGTASRSLHHVAGSFEELTLLLTPDEDALNDMTEFAIDDGYPERPGEIQELRRRWSAKS